VAAPKKTAAAPVAAKPAKKKKRNLSPEGRNGSPEAVKKRWRHRRLLLPSNCGPALMKLSRRGHNPVPALLYSCVSSSGTAAAEQRECAHAAGLPPSATNNNAPLIPRQPDLRVRSLPSARRRLLRRTRSISDSFRIGIL